MLLKSSACLLIFGPCCLIRRASSIARSCLLCSVVSIVTFGNIWATVVLLVMFVNGLSTSNSFGCFHYFDEFLNGFYHVTFLHKRCYYWVQACIYIYIIFNLFGWNWSVKMGKTFRIFFIFIFTTGDRIIGQYNSVKYVYILMSVLVFIFW